ncbi:MAG: hypothetical protein HZA81_02480 [Candidatus Taylorbacteria bacterium]|nr:hypothetical protein [Candidatus Taylorbacteria bacterium]
MHNNRYVVASVSAVPLKGCFVRINLDTSDPRLARVEAKNLIRDRLSALTHVSVHEVVGDRPNLPKEGEDDRTLVFHASRAPGDGEWRESFYGRFSEISETAFVVEKPASPTLVSSDR